MEETTNQTHFTLVILAAGLGSRFGGLKQLTPIAPNGECILDFSIYDALQYGVNKIVLIIRKETHQLFQEHLKKIAKKIEIIYRIPPCIMTSCFSHVFSCFSLLLRYAHFKFFVVVVFHQK